MPTLYFTQSGSGSADGSSYANAASAAAFNASTYQVNNDICYLAGTFTTQLQIKDSGLEIRSYSADPFIFEGNDATSYGIYCTGTGFTITSVKLYDLTIRNCTLNGIYINSNVNSLTTCIIDNCTVTGTGRYYAGAADTTTGTGILLINVNFLKSISGISVTNCTSTDNGKHGFDFRGSCIGTVSNCYAARNGSTNTGHGFHTNSCRFEINEANFTNTSGTIYQYTGSLSGYTIVDVYVAKTETDKLWLTNAGSTTTPANGEFGQVGTTLYINIGQSPTGTEIALVATDTTDLVIEDCISEYNIDVSGIEGTGFSQDNAAYNVRHIRCISRYNEGAGFYSFKARNSSYISCIAHDNGYGGFEHISVARDCALYHCVSVRNGQQGYHFPRSIRPTVKNCIAYQNTLYGFEYDSGYSTGLVEGGNFSYGNTEGNYLAMTVTEADPLFISTTDFRLQSGSPCHRAGTAINSYQTFKDFNGEAFERGNPTIGAYKQQFRDTITILGDYA